MTRVGYPGGVGPRCGFSGFSARSGFSDCSAAAGFSDFSAAADFFGFGADAGVSVFLTCGGFVVLAGRGWRRRPGAAALLPRVGSEAGPTPREVFGFGPASGFCDRGGLDFCLACVFATGLFWPGAVALLPRSGVAAWLGLTRIGFPATTGFACTTRGVTVAATKGCRRAGVAAAGSTFAGRRDDAAGSCTTLAPS